MKINRSNKQTKTIIIIASSVVISLVIGWGAFSYYKKVWPFAAQESVTPTSAEGDDSINLDPPTQQEIEESQDAKKRVTQTDQNPNESIDAEQSEKKSVGVGISFADVYKGNLEIRAFTNGAIQGTGTCTATVTKGGQTITKSVKAFIDTSSTQCHPIYIPVEDLNAGTWNVSVKFVSPDHEGVSETVEVSVS